MLQNMNTISMMPIDNAIRPIDLLLLLLLVQLLLLLVRRQKATGTLISAQVVRQITPVELLGAEAVAEKRKRIATVGIFDSIILESRLLEEIDIDQSTAREDGRLPVEAALFEPASTRARPGGALQEEVGVFDKGLADVEAGSERLDLFLLHLLDDGDDVPRDQFDDGDE